MKTSALRYRDHSTDPAYQESNTFTRESLLDLMRRTATERELWALETMKHVALIALAGLGGVFALLGAGKGDARLAFWAALFFAFSSAICVMGMHVGSLIRMRYIDHICRLLDRLGNNDILSQEDFADPAHIKSWNIAGNGIGWATAISAGIAGILLFQALP